MFASDPDSILSFIEHEVEDEFNVETTLRDFNTGTVTEEITTKQLKEAAMERTGTFQSRSY